jgi:hypothetical protein
MIRNLSFLLTVLWIAAGTHADSAYEIIKDSGVKGGFVVVIGCDNPELLVGLRANESYLIHGLDTDTHKIDKAREFIQSMGLYGKVTVDTFNGVNLPYVNNSVNQSLAAKKQLNRFLRILMTGRIICMTLPESAWARTPL